MKERPIIFSAESVVAILEGRKTQTRRVVTAWNDEVFKCPFGEPGDRLWVRETWATLPSARNPVYGDSIFYKDDPNINDIHFNWRSPMFMPRWASRCFAVMTRVRVQRVQEISLEDIYAEGCKPISSDMDGSELYEWFADYWDSLNAKRGYGWDKNPWVWVVDFKVVKK